MAPADAAAKVILTRGAGGRGYSASPGLVPTRLVAAFPLPERVAERARDGVAVRRCTLQLSEQPRLAGAKTLNRLENVLARAEWDDASFAEGLLGDPGGRVIEATMSNVFVVTAGRVATPRLDRCGVVGAQRERVREMLAAEGIACVEREIPWADLEAADEIFLTSSLVGACPVRAFEAWQRDPGPVTRRVQALIAAADGDPA